MTPDPQRDVMVYQVAMLDALGGAAIGDRWTVWVGRENEASVDSEAEAIAIATGLAEDHGRPAWLVNDDGAIMPL